MHFIDEFRKESQEHIIHNAPCGTNVNDLAQWLKVGGIQLFKNAFFQETGQIVPNLPNGQLIEQAYPKNLNEINKQQKKHPFYAANAKIFCNVCMDIVDSILNSNSDPRHEIYAGQHYHLLRNLTLDALALLSDWAALTQDTPAMYGIVKNNQHDSFQISQAADQLMFGGSRLFSFSDLATDAGTALLRVALETRIRFGFGLLGVMDLSNQSVLPLNMSKILEAIKLHQDHFKLAIPLPHIERIYGWSNIYVHIGLKHFTWSPIFAHKYLNPLLRGGSYPGGSSVYAGICIDEKTIVDIQHEAGCIYGLDATKYELITIPPAQCSVILTT